MTFRHFPFFCEINIKKDEASSPCRFEVSIETEAFQANKVKLRASYRN